MPFLNPSLARSACALAPIGAEKGDFDDKIAAIVSAASRQPKRLPSKSSFPRNTSSGSFASCLPRGVRSSPGVRALTSTSESMARRIFFASGGSRASDSVCSMPPSLQILTRRTRSCRERRSISGVCCSDICDGVRYTGPKIWMLVP